MTLERLAHLASYAFLTRDVDQYKNMSLAQLYQQPRTPFSQNALLLTSSFCPINIAKFLRNYLLKKTPTQVFSCEVCENASAFPVAASLIFFLKKAISQPCYDVLIFFSSRHTVWCIKSRTCLFINLSSIVRFSKWLRQGVPCKAETCHTCSHEQYFSKNRFLDICRCAFK